jgi:hypothetical protein
VFLIVLDGVQGQSVLRTVSGRNVSHVCGDVIIGGVCFQAVVCRLRHAYVMAVSAVFPAHGIYFSHPWQSGLLLVNDLRQPGEARERRWFR